jgi:hypothetical protein
VRKANKHAANIVPREKKKRRRLEFHRLHVFAAAFMTLPFVENSIVGNAIAFGRSPKKYGRRVRTLICPVFTVG